MFISKLADADSEGAETQVWLDFARDGGYLSRDRHDELIEGYEEVGRMLGSMMAKLKNLEQGKQRVKARLSKVLPSAFCILLTVSCLLLSRR